MSNPLANPQLRLVLLEAARRRVVASDAEDIVQGVLVEALSAQVRPATANELERWLRAVLKNKIVDHYRRSRREKMVDQLPEIGFEEPDLDLLKWAMAELPEGADAPKALEWAMREGEGEKLEQIAETERIPAPRVRQRVVRLRQHFKRRWALYAATLGGVLLLALGLIASRRPEPIARETDTPEERGRRIRERAFEECPHLSPDACILRLDEAKRLDPAGDTQPAVRTLRDNVQRSKEPTFLPSVPDPVLPSAMPSGSAPVRVAPPTQTAVAPLPANSATLHEFGLGTTIKARPKRDGATKPGSGGSSL